jgi:hypothetical protein
VHDELLQEVVQGDWCAELRATSALVTPYRQHHAAWQGSDSGELTRGELEKLTGIMLGKA